MDRLAKLESVINDQDRDVLAVYRQAVEQNRQAVKAKPTKANLDNLAAAESLLSQKIDELYARRFPEEQSEKFFGKGSEVHRYLKSEGFNVSESTVYQHIQDQGLKPRRDGRYAGSDVIAYAKEKWPRPEDKQAALAGDLGNEKAQLDIETRRIKKDMPAFQFGKDRGTHIPRTEAAHTLLATLAAFRTNAERLVRTSLLLDEKQRQIILDIIEKAADDLSHTETFTATLMPPEPTTETTIETRENPR